MKRRSLCLMPTPTKTIHMVTESTMRMRMSAMMRNMMTMMRQRKMKKTTTTSLMKTNRAAHRSWRHLALSEWQRRDAKETLPLQILHLCLFAT